MAQNVAFEDDFNCVDEEPHGPSTFPFGWRNTRPGSTGDWSTENGDHLYATSDDSSVTSYDDAYEVFLVTGDPSWSDFEIEVDLNSGDNDTMGLVARHNAGSSWYSCIMTGPAPINRWPNCNAGIDTGAGQARVIRYDGSAAYVHSTSLLKSFGFGWINRLTRKRIQGVLFIFVSNCEPVTKASFSSDVGFP